MKIGILIVASVALFLFFLLLFSGPDGETKKETTDYIPPDADIEKAYEKKLEISQSDLRLDKEAIQYEILFHKNTSVKIQMILDTVQTERNPVAYLMMLTDGKKPINNETIIRFVRNPVGTIYDITTNRRHIMIGGRIIYKIFNLGYKDNVTSTKMVRRGEVWYLTIAVFRSDKEDIQCILDTSVECMETINVTRTGKINFFSSHDNDFKGRYFGMNILPVLRIGFSVALDLGKTVNTNNGSIVIFNSISHIGGKITIEQPNGEMFSSKKKLCLTYNYFGNLTGEWKFKARGIGFPRKHTVSLFYVDIDPHIDFI